MKVEGVCIDARTGASIRGSSMAALMLTSLLAVMARVFEMARSRSGLALVFPGRNSSCTWWLLVSVLEAAPSSHQQNHGLFGVLTSTPSHLLLESHTPRSVCWILTWL